MNPDLIVGIFSAAFGVAYAVMSWNLPDASIGNPMAPKYFPLGVGVLAVILAIMLIVRGVGRGKVASKKKAPDKGYWVLIVGLIVCCLVYAFILEKIGFIISTIIFLLGMLFLVNGVKGWLANIITAVIYSVGVWYIFEKVFQLSLP